MIAAELNSTVSTIRIHDEFCDSSIDSHISRLSRIVSESYKRRQLASEAGLTSPSVMAAPEKKADA